MLGIGIKGSYFWLACQKPSHSLNRDGGETAAYYMEKVFWRLFWKWLCCSCCCMKVTMVCLHVFLILDNLWFFSGSGSRRMVKRVFLAAKMVTKCGNSFPYVFSAISCTVEIGRRSWSASYKRAWHILNQDTEHKLNVVWLWKLRC